MLEIFKKGLGFIGIVDDNWSLFGVFIDGDLCCLLDVRVDIYIIWVVEVMIIGCKIL